MYLYLIVVDDIWIARQLAHHGSPGPRQGSEKHHGPQHTIAMTKGHLVRGEAWGFGIFCDVLHFTYSFEYD